MDKVKAVLTSIVTYITIIQAVLVILAEEIAGVFADGDAETVINVIIRIGVVLTAVVSIIRRVTPVLPQQRGLTLPDGVSRGVMIKHSRDEGYTTAGLVIVTVLVVLCILIIFGAINVNVN